MHVARPAVSRREPVHVTLRVCEGLPSLRSKTVYPAVLRALQAVNPELGLRVVEHSAQRDHLHLIVEVEDRQALCRGMQGLSIRLAKAINRSAGRPRGKVFRDRYHVEVLRTPRQARNALGYVLNNLRHHLDQRGAPQYARDEVDELSSAPWFTGWSRRMRDQGTGPPPHPTPRTWLLRTGWQRHGRIDPGYVPPSGQVAKRPRKRA